jgi:hypothetical protein
MKPLLVMLSLLLRLVVDGGNRHRERRFVWHLRPGNNVQIYQREVELLVNARGRVWRALDAIRISAHLTPLADRKPQMPSLVQLHGAVPQDHGARATLGNLLEQVDLLIPGTEGDGSGGVAHLHLGHEDARSVDSALVYHQLHLAHQPGGKRVRDCCQKRPSFVDATHFIKRCVFNCTKMRFERSSGSRRHNSEFAPSSQTQLTGRG